VIHIRIDPAEVGKNRRADVGIAADPGNALRQIQAAFSSKNGSKNREKWVDTLQKARQEAEKEIEPLLNSDEKPIQPARLWKEIRDFLPRNAVVMGDGGDCFFWGFPIIKVFEPGHFVKCSAELGHLGAGIPMSIGAKIARPDSPVLLFTGDGSFGFNAMEFDTAIRHNIPFVCVVANDGKWGMVNNDWVRRYGDEKSVGIEIGLSHYERMVEGLGGHGELVTEPADILPALERAFDSGKPACVNVVAQGYSPKRLW
jgi:acetolactate synthase-1/2/3 large subunit